MKIEKPFALIQCDVFNAVIEVHSGSIVPYQR